MDQSQEHVRFVTTWRDLAAVGVVTASEILVRESDSALVKRLQKELKLPCVAAKLMTNEGAAHCGNVFATYVAAWHTYVCGPASGQCALCMACELPLFNRR